MTGVQTCALPISTPNLMRYCSNGKNIDQAKLTVRKAGGTAVEYITITVKELIISSISMGGSGGEDRLTENVTLNFASFDYEYTPQKDDGSADTAIPFKWNIAQNIEE